MRMNLMLGVAAAALMLPTTAFAQSTGSAEADNVGTTDIVVTGAREAGVGGVDVPNTSKNKQVLNQTFISRQTPGQTVNDIINQLPGVSFQNNDPFGSAGGTLTIRGFDGSRISQTFDGIPLNDTGNYAIYSNQQLDPELIEQVNVNLGSTDPDSPTASASGSTVNYRTLIPTDDFGARMIGSVGDYSFFRVFGLVNTGVLTSFGTKAWFSGSSATNDVVFNNFGKINKQQYNGKIYQPIGSGKDFISISGHYNQNRNNFFGSAPLRYDTNVFTSTGGTGANAAAPTLNTGAVRTAGTGSLNRFPNSRDELPYSIARCQIATPRAGVADTPALVNAPGASNNGSGCGTSFDERANPSNTANIRINSRFSLGDKLTLFVDPSYQYTKANGGGTVTARETGFTRTTGVPIATPQYGFIGGQYYFGRDINGDGDTLDQVTVLAPSQTQTRRYGVIASLRYDFSDSQSIRVGYTLDYGRHRQTGETGFLQANGVPFDVFPVNNGIAAVNGGIIQKRNRLSKAILNQGFAQYIGNFFEDKLRIEASLTGKWFKRDLTNYCFVTAANGNLDCLATEGSNAAYASANPYVVGGTTAVPTITGYAAPQQRTYKYDKLLPAGGLTYTVSGALSIFGNYSKGIQVPGTDNLYQAFYYPQNTTPANPTPETTDNFDAGIRYASGRVQASVGPWYTRFQNRLASAYDIDTQQTIYRNLGRVDKYGVDASVAYRPINELLFYVYGSYLKSEIKTNVEIGRCPTVLTAANTTANCTVAGAPILAQTAGMRESGAPVYTFGGRVQATLGPLELGAQAKRTGRRYVNDQNLGNFACTVALVNNVCPTVANVSAAYTGTRGIQYQTYDAFASGYTVVDFDARLSLDWTGIGGKNKTYLQFNVVNAFNKFYVGGFTGGQTLSVNNTIPFVQIGSPRAFIMSLNVGI
ncbi:TonB-dependent receptor [Sphingomonas sp. RP10(2022)]|uniref:TonB-dependent receptor n=2 Tax=Sphingomonas liriopis TaxID=2949094 RepID=A0A9X2HUC9_9SPHN|nr:TonB-dependent receptor [Sphingomonas liriopis]MCP3733654.1 TonB-dependent receptor [Sphingomonas liriopis]